MHRTLGMKNDMGRLCFAKQRGSSKCVEAASRSEYNRPWIFGNDIQISGSDLGNVRIQVRPG